MSSDPVLLVQKRRKTEQGAKGWSQEEKSSCLLDLELALAPRELLLDMLQDVEQRTNDQNHPQNSERAQQMEREELVQYAKFVYNTKVAADDPCSSGPVVRRAKPLGDAPLTAAHENLRIQFRPIYNMLIRGSYDPEASIWTHIEPVLNNAQQWKKTKIERFWNLFFSFVEEEAHKGNAFFQAVLSTGYLGQWGLTVDEGAFYSWALRSAFQKHHLGLNNLGYAYLMGLGTNNNDTRAVQMFTIAIKFQNPASINNLAYCYQHGRGVARDFGKAREIYEQAISLGIPTAINNLALMYENGNGVTRDIAKALELYRTASEAGSSFAMNNLGVCYQFGKGVQADTNTAIEWYKKSAILNNPHAKQALERLDMMKIFLSEQQIQRAQAELLDKQNQQLLLLLLCWRHYVPHSPFHHTFLPLDLFKEIVSLSELEMLPKSANLNDSTNSNDSTNLNKSANFNNSQEISKG